jgi:hypothetical protein
MSLADRQSTKRADWSVTRVRAGIDERHREIDCSCLAVVLALFLVAKKNSKDASLVVRAAVLVWVNPTVRSSSVASDRRCDRSPSPTPGGAFMGQSRSVSSMSKQKKPGDASTPRGSSGGPPGKKQRSRARRKGNGSK